MIEDQARSVQFEDWSKSDETQISCTPCMTYARKNDAAIKIGPNSCFCIFFSFGKYRF